MRKITVLILVITLFYPVFAMNRQIDLIWNVGHTHSKEVNPERFIPSTVPGAVQLDIAADEKYPPLAYADNYKMYGWMEDKYYIYRTTFDKPNLKEGELLFFHSKGIDYRFDIYLNNVLLHSQEGMFTYVDLDLTQYLKNENELKIIIYPVPKLHPFPVDRSQAAHVAKPPVSYGWDWHPRLVPLGIWDETCLLVRGNSHLNDIYLNYELSDKLDKAAISLEVEGSRIAGKPYRWQLADENGKKVLAQEGKLPAGGSPVEGIILDKPQLWWPHDQGKPYLYISRFELLDEQGNIIDIDERKIGFRRVRLVMNEGAWDEPDGFPKTRSVPPAQLEINGRRIFAKGSNWVNPEIFPGQMTRERYAELILRGKEANMNIFRIWGGGIVNKESFFELCDESGMLVWQEFPLACNPYPDDKHYLDVLKQEAASIVKRVRKHPSLAMWCGGNELFNSWSGMTDQSLPLRLLNSICLAYDPLIPYIPTSPLMGMAHGNYIFRYFDGTEVFQAMNNAHFTAYTEFGMPGISPREVLEKIIPEEELWSPKPATAWETHHAFGAWAGDTWICKSILDHYFGEAATLDELIEQSQLLQCEGYKAIFEEARRQKPYCSMAINWCYQEPWPAAANNSLIVYPNTPKPAYYAVGNSCRPVCASARLHKFGWKEGEVFTADLYILNDRFKEGERLTVSVKLQCNGKTVEVLKWDAQALESNKNAVGPAIRYELPHWENAKRFKLLLEVNGKPEYNSEYTLLYTPKTVTKKGTAIMNLD